MGTMIHNLHLKYLSRNRDPPLHRIQRRRQTRIGRQNRVPRALRIPAITSSCVSLMRRAFPGAVFRTQVHRCVIVSGGFDGSGDLLQPIADGGGIRHRGYVTGYSCMKTRWPPSSRTGLRPLLVNQDCSPSITHVTDEAFSAGPG